MTPKQWQYIETVLDDILAFPPAKRKLQLAKWFGDDEQTHFLARRLVQLSERGQTSPELPSEIGGWVPVRSLGANSNSCDYLVSRADDGNHPLAILHLGLIAFEEGSAIQNFREELKRVDSLTAESLCRIFDAGLDDFNHPYIVNEIAVGIPILEAARDFNIRPIVETFRNLILNVENSHSRNVPHGNFHPTQILLGKGESIRLQGFAVRRILSLAANNSNFVLNASISPGEILYCSPDKLSGSGSQLSGDIYSLGVIFYQMLSGATPYGNRDETLVELAGAISEKVPARIAGIDDVLNQILQKMLEKNPANRYADLARLITEIDDYLEGRHLKVQAKASPKPANLFQAILQQGRQRWVAVTLGLVVVAASSFGISRFTASSVQDGGVEGQKAATSIGEKTPFQVAKVYLESTFAATRNQPDLQRAFSRAYASLAGVEGNGSDPKLALASSRLAFELSGMVLDRGPNTESMYLEYALAARIYIYFLEQSGDYKQALQVNQQWQKRFSKASSSNIEIIRASALANTTLANVLYESKLSTPPSDAVYERDYASLRNAIQAKGDPSSSDGSRSNVDFAQAMVGLGEAIELSKFSSGAIHSYNESRRILEEALALESGNHDVRAALADTLIHMARVHVKSRTVDMAVQVSNRAVALLRQTHVKQESNPSFRRLFARALSANAAALVAAQRRTEATKVQGEALAQWQQLEHSHGLNPGDKVEVNNTRLIGRG